MTEACHRFTYLLANLKLLEGKHQIHPQQAGLSTGHAPTDVLLDTKGRGFSSLQRRLRSMQG